MSKTQYDPPAGGPPPPAYGSEAATGSSVPSPAPAHVQPEQFSTSGAPPNNTYNQGQGGYGGQQPAGQWPPQQQGPGGYYAPGPQMGYAPQGQYYGQQGPYGPQGSYGPGGYGGGYAPGYGPQGQYLDDRRGGSMGFMETFLASLACCFCLDCLLF